MLQGKQGEHTLIGTSVIGNIAVNSVCSNPCQHRPAANASPCSGDGCEGEALRLGLPVSLNLKYCQLEKISYFSPQKAMLRTIAFLSLGLLLCSRCGPQAEKAQDKNPAEEAAASVPALDEDAVVLQLSGYLLAKPQGQAETDQNEIANYAIENVLPLERTASGLFYQILQPGQGELLEWGDYLRAHYRGYFLDGQVFDSSYRRNKPLEFYLGNMIAGWNEGLQLLRPGGKIRLLVPSSLAYGEQGLPDGKGGFLVPPNAVLAFEVEVLEKLAAQKR
jgi:FKBP-type peptidyl-prolyl cis-trans isomerase FkpA